MRRALLTTLVLAVMVMAFSGVALAATPMDIYEDYADNSKLDGTYTDAELQAYLGDATLAQYPPSAATKAELDTLVKSLLNRERGEFPFTGMEMALLLVGAVVLVGGGVALRRSSR